MENTQQRSLRYFVTSDESCFNLFYDYERQKVFHEKNLIFVPKNQIIFEKVMNTVFVDVPPKVKSLMHHIIPIVYWKSSII